MTGGSSGIGAAIARQAAGDGHDVVVVSRRPGPVGRSVPIDLSTAAGWEGVARLFETEASGADRLDCWHAAGTLTPIGFAGAVDPGEYRSNVLLNGAGALLVGEAFLRAVAGSEVEASLVMITSGAASTPYPGWSSYCAGKAAVDQWTRCVGLEQADSGGVRVVAIAPGVVDTDMQSQIRRSSEERFPGRQRFVDLHARGELGDPDVVARRMRSALPRLVTGSVVDLRSLPTD